MLNVYYTEIPGNINKNETISALFALVSPQKNGSMRDIPNADRVLVSLTGSRLLEKHASALLGVPVSDITYENLTSGKPRFAFDQNVSFNISHSGNTVCAALNICGGSGPYIEVGVDCEEFIDQDQKLKSMTKLTERYFSEAEIGYVSGCRRKAEKCRRFYKLWTAREAHAKLSGTGIFREISDKDVIVIDQKGGLSYRDGKLLRQFFTERAVITLAADRLPDPADITLINVPFNELPA